MDNYEPAEIWRKIIVSNPSAWVLFEHGTCVILKDGGENAGEAARALLAKWGPVHAGTPSADFDVIPLRDVPGYVVTCHHPDILNYVPPEENDDDGGEEGDDDDSSDVLVGLLGRGDRDLDAQELRVVHIEHNITLGS